MFVVCGAGFLGALEILRRAIPIWKTKKMRGELCHVPQPSNIKRVVILKAAFTRPAGILLKQQTKSEIRGLEVMKRKPQKRRMGNRQAIISQGN